MNHPSLKRFIVSESNLYASLHEVRADFDAGDGGGAGEGGGAVEDRAQPAADVQHLNKEIGDESQF